MTNKSKLAFIGGMRGLFVAIVLVGALALSDVAAASSEGADAPPPPSEPGCPPLSMVCKKSQRAINRSLPWQQQLKQQLERDRKISIEGKQPPPYTEIPRTRFTNIRDAQRSTDRQFDKFWRSPLGKILLLFFAALVIKFLIDMLGELVALGKKRQKD